jgi:transposase InsO family protein
LTDNGLEFTDKCSCGKEFVSSNHKFDTECKADEIEHRLTDPYTPQTNGMVERVNGTIKNATIKAEEYNNIEDVKKD